MTRVKICGITNLRDAEDAVEFGADAIGFVFAKSPRRISLNDAKKISLRLGPWVTTVGVFVNETKKNILRIASECRFSAIQLHGDESASELSGFGVLKIIKAFRISKKEDLKVVETYKADAYLFDTKAGGIYGGSGKRFDWNILRMKNTPKPYIISGGLDPRNVQTVICKLSPYGVDVSSGVEKYPGKKDPVLVKQFIKNAKK